MQSRPLNGSNPLYKNVRLLSAIIKLNFIRISNTTEHHYHRFYETFTSTFSKLEQFLAYRGKENVNHKEVNFFSNFCIVHIIFISLQKYPLLYGGLPQSYK